MTIAVGAIVTVFGFLIIGFGHLEEGHYSLGAGAVGLAISNTLIFRRLV